MNTNEIMLDTNILISAALFPSASMTAFLTRVAKNHHIVLCSYILDELNDVIRRKFPGKQRQVEVFLQKLPFSLVHTPKLDLVGLDIAIRDEADYPILMSAVLADVDILITGDKGFHNAEIEKPKIMTPAEFMAQSS